MSRAVAEIHLLNGTVLYSQYDGTGCDCVLTKLYTTVEEVFPRGSWAECSNPATHKQVPARLYHYYGGGEAWDTTVCQECQCITGATQSFDPIYNNPFAIIDNHEKIDKEWKEKTHPVNYHFTFNNDNNERIIQKDLEEWKRRVTCFSS